MAGITPHDSGACTPKKDEVNILLLGPTGAGKSTLINALANYLSYESLEAALQGTPVNLVPLRFSAFNENRDMSWIQLGAENNNENLKTGKSATQEPRTYVFRAPDITLRCIDTPGLGDVDGLRKDAENIKQTMKQLAAFDLDQLHGICIFIEPDTTRLTEYFTSCIDRLFQHLNKDAGKNIVFLFSKSRPHGQQTADSYSTLQQLIRDKQFKSIALGSETAYFVDNAAVRLLAKSFNHVPLTPEEKVDCTACWDSSVREIGRLLDHVRSIKPHDNDSTVFLNKVKATVVALTDPMIKIAENAEKNISMLNHRMAAANEDPSPANLRVPKIVLKPRQVKPRMVCAGKCLKVKMVEGARIEKYDQVCHDDCFIRGLKFLNKISTLNRYCEVMEGGFCKICGCSWRVHKNVTWVFDEEVVEETVDDQDDQDEDSLAGDATSSIEDYVSPLEKAIEGHRAEKEKVVDVAVKLGIFLDQNAILATAIGFSNEIEDQMKNSITLEGDAGRDVNLKSMRALLQDYEDHKKNLLSMDIRVSATYANTLIGSLNSTNLPLNGAVVQECLAMVQREDAQLNSCKEVAMDCPRAIRDMRHRADTCT